MFIKNSLFSPCESGRLDRGRTLDDILPEAFAAVREAAKRVLGMEHYRVQMIGGIILASGTYRRDENW